MSEHARFTLPPLPYAADALAPAYSGGALCVHHDRILGAHIDSLNILLDGRPTLQGRSASDLLLTSRLPLADADEIRWHAGAICAHTLYFRSMCPPSGGYPIPHGRLAELLLRDVGSYAEFCYRFRRAALSLAGAGFLYLVQELSSGRIRLLTCRDYGVPSRARYKPLLCADLWEHAYFSDYAEDRALAVDAFLSVVNWKEAERNLQENR